MPPRSRSTLHYVLRPRPPRRVRHRAGLLAGRSRLGLWQRLLRYPADDDDPRLSRHEAASQYALLARTNRLSLLGVRRTRRIGQDNEFERLRDYTIDDNYKHIDWRAPPGGENSRSRTTRPVKASGSCSSSIAAG